MALKKTHIEILIAITISFGFSYQSAFAQVPETINIDLSGTANPSDFPYGIECDADPNFCFISIHSQGILAKIDKTTKAVTLIADSLESASGGKDFYAITTDGNGNLFIPERDNGEVKKYNINTDTWSRIVVMEQVVHPLVSYPNGYLVNPNLIQVIEPVHDSHIYQFSSNSFGGIEFSNGSVWEALNYYLDFDSFAESVGVIDVTFNGLAKINPITDTVSRIPLSASDVRGLSVDSVDSDILWITSQSDDQIIKFNTSTELVLDSATLTSGSNPRGLSTDNNFLYVALNKPAGGTSEILKISKTDLNNQQLIDTTAPNTNGGTFTTFVFGNFLLWSDQSNHIGVYVIPLSQNFVFTTTDANSNHFMDVVGTDIWVAGQGSAVVSTLDTNSIPVEEGGGGEGGGESEQNNGGDSAKHLTKPTMGEDHNTHKTIVTNGLLVNGETTNVKEFYTPFNKKYLKVGESNSFSSTGYYQNGGPAMAKLYFGLAEIGNTASAEVTIETLIDYQGQITENKIYGDNGLLASEQSLIDKDSIETSIAKVSCGVSSKQTCHKITWDLVFNEAPIHDKFAIELIDQTRRNNIYTFNEGVKVLGDSLNPPMIQQMAFGKYGLLNMTRIDKANDIWVSEQGLNYTKNSFGTWIQSNPTEFERFSDHATTVMNRLNSNFQTIIDYEKNRATLIFDSEEIQSELGPSFAYTYPDKTDREILLEELGWIPKS